MGRSLVKTLRRHPGVALCLLLTAAVVLVRGAERGYGVKAVAYLVAMLVCVGITDTIMARRPAPPSNPVRAPTREAVFIAAGIAAGGVGLWFHKANPELEATYPALRVLFAALVFGFAFPVVPSLYLLLRRYHPRELGFDPRRLVDALWLVPPLLVVTASTAWLVHPEGVTAGRGLSEFGGFVPLLLATFVGAALPEETFRFLLQTRLGRALNPAAGWLTASYAWAFFHLPMWYAESGDVLASSLGCVRIVPLGLMWGYVTHRTGNLWTAWLLHGANLWGLQNF